jgi:hypothetical protein
MFLNLSKFKNPQKYIYQSVFQLWTATLHTFVYARTQIHVFEWCCKETGQKQTFNSVMGPQPR